MWRLVEGGHTSAQQLLEAESVARRSDDSEDSLGTQPDGKQVRGDPVRFTIEYSSMSILSTRRPHQMKPGHIKSDQVTRTKT